MTYSPPKGPAPKTITWGRWGYNQWICGWTHSDHGSNLVNVPHISVFTGDLPILSLFNICRSLSFKVRSLRTFSHKFKNFGNAFISFCHVLLDLCIYSGLDKKAKLHFWRSIYFWHFLHLRTAHLCSLGWNLSQPQPWTKATSNMSVQRKHSLILKCQLNWNCQDALLPLCALISPLCGHEVINTLTLSLGSVMDTHSFKKAFWC